MSFENKWKIDAQHSPSDLELDPKEILMAFLLDDFIASSAVQTLYQLPQWRQVINSAYGHQTHYLIALRNGANPRIVELSKWVVGTEGNAGVGEAASAEIAGVLPLIHLRSLAFGNDLISLPFFDSGGVLADDVDVEKALLIEAVHLARRLKARSIQLRQTAPIISLSDSEAKGPDNQASNWLTALNCTVERRTHKACMLLELPDSAETLMGSFKSKLRSQIRKPTKEGLIGRIGGLEFLDDFYKVFSINMRDLGSPVHSKGFIKNVLEVFPRQSRICLVYMGRQPLACSVVIGYQGRLYNPWASSLRKYSSLSPNMLLYWTMLEYACENGYKYFDFGRSSIDEATYKFKGQWGAKPQPLYWYYISFDKQPFKPNAEKSQYGSAIRLWQKLPVNLTQFLGPRIRKYIGL